MSENQKIEIDDADMPAVFRLADRASIKAQRAFIIWMAINLILIIGSSVLGAFSFFSEASKSLLALMSAGLMAAGLLITLYIRSQKFEENGARDN